MIKHTPGPWKIRRESMLDWHIECKSNIPGFPGTVARVGYKPNARLICAAPELLKACEYAITIFKNDSHCGEKFFNGENSAIKKLEISIAKAKAK